MDEAEEWSWEAAREQDLIDGCKALGCPLRAGLACTRTTDCGLGV